MFYYVQLWQTMNQKQPSLQQRVQAPSEGHAIIQVMRKHHFTTMDRGWVSYSAKEPPTVRLINIMVKGSVRRWQQEPEAGSSWDRLLVAAQELGYCIHRDLHGITLEHDQYDPIQVAWREVNGPTLTNFLYTQQRQHPKRRPA